VEEGAFPPCIKKMLSLVAKGTNLGHSARFALVSFLLQINMSSDQVIALFNTSPDFDGNGHVIKWSTLQVLAGLSTSHHHVQP